MPDRIPDRIPDAPWVREAERWGMPDPPPVRCPCCGEEAEIFYADISGAVIGCNVCITPKDPYD